MTATLQRQSREMREKHQPAQVVRVVRSGMNATYIWNRKPNRQECNAALLADPPCRPRVGHCWPGFDERPYDPMPTPTILPTGEAINRARHPAQAQSPTEGAGQDERARYTGGA